MQNKIRAWSSLFLSAVFFITVFMEYIPTPQDIIELTFLTNFGIGILLLLTGIRLLKGGKFFPTIVYQIGLVTIMLVFIICLAGLTGIYKTHFEGEFFFLHVVNPLLFFFYNIIFIECPKNKKSVLLTPVPAILYLYLDLIIGSLSGKYIYDITPKEEWNIIKSIGVSAISYFFILFIGYILYFFTLYLKTSCKRKSDN